MPELIGILCLELMGILCPVLKSATTFIGIGTDFSNKQLSVPSHIDACLKNIKKTGLTILLKNLY
jgi:hypothetical protein